MLTGYSEAALFKLNAKNPLERGEPRSALLITKRRLIEAA